MPFCRTVRGLSVACFASLGSLLAAHAAPTATATTAAPGLEQGVPVRPLAQNFVAVGESPDPARIFIYTPTILALPNGRLVAAYEFGGKKMTDEERNPGNAFILTSDDHGKTWQLRQRMMMTHGRMFSAGGKVYFLGHRGDLRVSVSTDNGDTWSQPANLTKGQSWHQSACNVWKAKGNVYLVMERRVGKDIKGWSVGELAPVLMRAKETDDLTKPESWTFSKELTMKDAIPGYRENDMPLDYFGVPFYRQNFPNRTLVSLTAEEQAQYARTKTPVPADVNKRSASPIGWLESNVVQITDPNHYWYDPTGKTFHIFMRANTGGTGYAAVLKAVEKDDGTIDVGFEHAPSGKIMLFVPFPGGQMRFHVLYDETSKLYWLLSSQATDSMTRAEALAPDRYGLPNNERQRLALYFSKNMIDWCFAGMVAITTHNNESRHYAGMDIDGDDLVILSRSGDTRSESAHNGDMATFHRVKNFRNLIY